MEDFKPLNAGTVKKETKKRRGCGGIAFLIFLLIAGIAALFGWWKYYYTYSEGFRSGQLQKFSHKGNFMKTYEGELILSSVTSSANVALASEKFFFSVANDSLAKMMMNYEGKNVRLHYEQKKGALPWVGDSEYIVDALEPVSANSLSPMLPPVQ